MAEVTQKEDRSQTQEAAFAEVGGLFDRIWQRLATKDRVEGSFGQRRKVFKPRISADELRASGVDEAFVRFLLGENPKRKINVVLKSYESGEKNAVIIDPSSSRNVSIYVGRWLGDISLPFVRLGGVTEASNLEADKDLKPARELCATFSRELLTPGDHRNALSFLRAVEFAARKDNLVKEAA